MQRGSPMKGGRILGQVGTQVVFASLAVLFFLLAAGDFTGSAGLKIFAGYEGIFCGLSAMYAALAQVLNEIYKKPMLPL